MNSPTILFPWEENDLPPGQKIIDSDKSSKFSIDDIVQLTPDAVALFFNPDGRDYHSKVGRILHISYCLKRLLVSDIKNEIEFSKEFTYALGDELDGISIDEDRIVLVTSVQSIYQPSQQPKISPLRDMQTMQYVATDDIALGQLKMDNNAIAFYRKIKYFPPIIIENDDEMIKKGETILICK